MCDSKFDSRNMLRKHINMKHPIQNSATKEGTVKDAYQVKHPIQQSQTKENTVKYVQQVTDSGVFASECLTCGDKFEATKYFEVHIKEHLEEIYNLDIEYLKSGHESFVCNNCEWNSNNVKNIKNTYQTIF